MKLACVVVLQKLELRVLSAGSCSLWCQTSGVSEPKAGICSKGRIAFCGSFSAPAYFEFKGRFYPKQILPSEVTSLYAVLPTASSA